MISDQERLWRERSPEAQPVYFEYPKSGYDVVTLHCEDDVELIQINDYRNRKKVYFVLLYDELYLVSSSRKEVDYAYATAKTQRKEAVRSSVNYNEIQRAV